MVRDVVLTLLDVPLVWLPLWRLCGAPATVRRAVPVVFALLTAAALRLYDVVRPALVAAEAKRRQLPVDAEVAAAGQRALGRAARESAVVRFVLHLLAGAAALLIVMRSADSALRSPERLGALVASALFFGAASAAVRALVVDRWADDLRPAVVPNLDRMRFFAGAYRARVLRLALAMGGLALAGMLLIARGQLHGEFEAATLLPLALPGVLLGAVLVTRSFLRRSHALEDYFQVALRPSTRGPNRDEPRAVAAFAAAQALPYRLGMYQAFALLIAVLSAVVLGRGVLGFGPLVAQRLLLGCALVVALSALYHLLFLRQLFRPLLRHLGSRHHLPVRDIRSRIGVGLKLAFAFVVVAVVSASLVMLTAGASSARAAVGVALAGAFALLGSMGLVVRQTLEPLASLESRSEELARGELARPVPPAGEADELGRLTIAFEEMRRSLRDRLRSTESINVDLEREVRRRTEALEQRNRELREALEQLRKAQDTLIRSEKLASMGRLVAGIAHEINNPINAVINSVEPLEELLRGLNATQGRAGDARATALAEVTSEAEQVLRVISRGAARTKAIVQALHNYSRNEETTLREVHLARSVDDTLDLLRHRLRGVRVEKHVPSEARFPGLPGQIDQVLMNLITNSLQALSPAGGTIRIESHVDDDAVILSVADDGPGIPADVLPRIFDPFFTTKDVGEGSGLGLSIVHGIVERHGGRIDVDSTPGVGTRFTLRFPRSASRRVSPLPETRNLTPSA